MPALAWPGTEAELVATLKRIPGILAGREPDPLRLSEVFFGHVGNRVLELITEDFKIKSGGGVGVDGEAWLPLAAYTLERRRRKGLTHEDILVEYGDLLKSLLPGVDGQPSGATGQVFRLEPGGITVGTEDRKADFHQKGAGRTPARPIVPPDGRLPAAWERPVEEAMEEAMVKVMEIVVAAGGIP